MAGNGAYPIRSTWLTKAPRPNTPILYARIGFGDTNTGEGTLWNAWFFGVVSGSPYSITFDTGTFTYTGQAVALKASRKLTLAAGAYVYTGNNIGLTYSGAPVSTGGRRGGGMGMGFGGMGRLGATHSPFGVSGPSAFALTDITSGRLFQRTASLTTGPVSAAGTYTGTAPSAIQFQILLVADDSVIKDWTTCGTATIGGGTWSATLTGVAQGGAYYLKARAANATSLAKTGSNSFYIGILFALYGQSNMVNFSSVQASAPAASAGTTWFNGTTWAAVPNANGIREFLNAVKAATGVPCAGLNGAVSGQSISTLRKGTANYTAFMAQIVAAGGDAEMVLWHQGEGDSAIGTQKYAYSAALDTLHSDIATDIGRTRSTMLMVAANLGTVINGDTTYGTDARWDAVYGGILDFAGKTAAYYSHTNRDAVLNNANVHYDAASQGRAGKRYARAVNTLLGATSGVPHWGITSSAVVDATHTTVDLTHGIGTDFTPTTGITGFELSEDNGLNWVTPSAAVRTSATRITLTHSSLATSSLRKLRYQYGLLPDLSGAVYDNSTLTLPLDSTGGLLSPTPLSTLPVPTWTQNSTSDVSTASQVVTGISIGPAATQRIVIVSFTVANPSLSAMTITPNVGTAKAATIVDQTAGTPGCGIAYAVLDADANTATLADIALTYSGNPFATTQVNVWVLPSADLNSATPTGHANVRTAGTTSVNVNVATSAGGFIIAVAADNDITANSGAVSGSEAWIGRRNFAAAGSTHVSADASGTAATATNNVAVTFSNSGNTSLVAAAWR